MLFTTCIVLKSGDVIPNSSLTQLLGGKKTLGREVSTRIDLIDLGRKGVSKESLLYMARFLELPVSKMASLLPVTECTIQRYAPKEHFDRVVSEHILQIAEVVARGREVFEDNDSFKTWIDQPSTALGGHSPKSLLYSQFGIDMVMDELTRIEHGVTA